MGSKGLGVTTGGCQVSIGFWAMYLYLKKTADNYRKCDMTSHTLFTKALFHKTRIVQKVDRQIAILWALYLQESSPNLYRMSLEELVLFLIRHSKTIQKSDGAQKNFHREDL